MTQLRGAVALVTGAAGGIGAATCGALQAAGATVVATDLRGADAAVDVTDAVAVDAAVDGIVNEHGRLDVVVTAAGIGVGGPLESVTGDEWRRVIDVNLWGTVHVVGAAYRHMQAAGRGHLAVVASLSSLVPGPMLVPYATTKAAVYGLASSLRPEATRHGVRVTAVCPGPVDTRLLDDGGEAGSVHGLDVRGYLTAAAGPALTPAQVAAAIVRGIERDRAVVLPGRARWLALGARLSPSTAERLVARAMRRAA